MARSHKRAALKALGVEPVVAPRNRGRVVVQERSQREPTWRDGLDGHRVWTNTRTPKAAERASVRSLDLTTRPMKPVEPEDLLKFPNVEKLRLRIAADDAALGPLLARAAAMRRLSWLILDYLQDAVAPEIGQLGQLRRLEIRGDWLAKRGPKALPPAVFELGKLEELVVEGGRLEAVPAGIARLTKLTWLDVGANRPLAKLARELAALPRLQHLELQRPNELSAKHVFDVLADAPDLRWLRFRGEDVASLPASVGKLRRIEHLTVGSALTSLPAAIGKLETLRSLDVEFNDLVTLPETLVELPRLAGLKLFANPRLDAAKAIALAVRCKKLRWLLLPTSNIPDSAYAQLQDAGFAQSPNFYGDLWIKSEASGRRAPVRSRRALTRDT